MQSPALVGASDGERYAESFQRKTVGVPCRVKKTPRVLLLQRFSKRFSIFHVVEAAEVFRILGETGSDITINTVLTLIPGFC